MSSLKAIDPPGCGCTECLIGEYVPLDRATPEDVAALFRGELRDHTEVHWTIVQKTYTQSDGFAVSGTGQFVDVDQIALPIPVANYTLTVQADSVDSILRGDLHLGG